MREIRTSGLMSGERKRDRGFYDSAPAPFLDSTEFETGSAKRASFVGGKWTYCRRINKRFVELGRFGFDFPNENCKNTIADTVIVRSIFLNRQAMIVRKQGDWLSAKVGDEVIMMSARKGSYLSLSEVAARVWELLETPQDRESLCLKLVQEFDVSPDVCRIETEKFLGEMVRYGALSFDSQETA